MQSFTLSVLSKLHTLRAPRTLLGLCALPLALAPAACLDNQLDTDGEVEVGQKNLFIAQTRDFRAYEDWMVFEHEQKADHGGLVGKVSVYVNELPDPETHLFPVGTILFKTMDIEGADRIIIHAMVKRSLSYNAQGALGWEYFELIFEADGTPVILWRGQDPPPDEKYQALLGAQNLDTSLETDGTCNSCHKDGQDGVLGKDLQELLNPS